MDEAWVTLSTNDTYALGALVLAHSLKKSGTSRQIVIMVTSNVSSKIRDELSRVFDSVIEVNVLDSHDTENLALIGRPDLGITFTKLHCWRLTQYTKCVFLDADTLLLQNCDDLFDREELSAAPDIGWPDCFNSGVFVFRPNLNTYQQLVKLGVEKGSFDGGDQGLLNLHFSDWATKDISRHLPFIYNMSSSSVYTYKPAYKQFGDDVKIVHFLGDRKPWSYSYNRETGRLVNPPTDNNELINHLTIWWSSLINNVFPKITDAESHLSSHVESTTTVFEPQAESLPGQLAGLSVGGSVVSEVDDATRRASMEAGNFDVTGRDSFANMQDHMDRILQAPAAPSAEADTSKDA